MSPSAASSDAQPVPAAPVMRTVLFVCSGNTCRSPLAEAVARHWLANDAPESFKDVFAASAGVAAMDGAATSPGTLIALRSLGIGHEGRSKGLTAEMIRKADLVLGMTREHVEAARQIIGEDDPHAEKIVRLDPDRDMGDPIGMGQDAYDALATRFRVLIPQRLEELLGHENRSGIGSSGG